jgi:hypothetical protein
MQHSEYSAHSASIGRSQVNLEACDAPNVKCIYDEFLTRVGCQRVCVAHRGQVIVRIS